MFQSFFFLVLLSLSTARWAVVQNSFGVPPGLLQYPLYSALTQINVFDRSTTFPWSVPLPAVSIGDGCSGLNANVTGKIAVGIEAGEANGVCTIASVQALVLAQGARALIWTNSRGNQYAWNAYTYSTIRNDLPVFWTGFANPFSDALFGSNYDSNLDGGAVLAFVVDADPNFTMAFVAPDQNPRLQGQFGFGGTQAAIYTSIGFGLINMLLAVWKLSAFLSIMERFRFSIPVTVILLMFIASFWVFLVFGLLGGSSVSNALQPQDVIDFLLPMTWGFLYSGIVVLGFYFGEVATLTSAQSVPGLDKLLIPAIIWIVIIWAIVFATGGIVAADTSFTLGEGATAFRNFLFAMNAVVLPLFALLPLLWGSFILIRQISGSPSMRGTILRVCGLSVLLLAILFSLLLFGMLLYFNPGNYLQSSAVPDYFTEVNFTYIRDFFFLIPILLTAFVILLSFTVQVSKEIEVSKSGTSSTSSGSSSSSKSTSSSSSSDPVIEL